MSEPGSELSPGKIIIWSVAALFVAAAALVAWMAIVPLTILGIIWLLYKGK